MQDYYNPFEYEAANKFDFSQIVDYYIEDFNYSRFIRSKRNVFLIGERGTGKTMTLLYNSLPVQMCKLEKENKKTDLDFIAIYIPCKTPLMHRKEYELLDPLKAAIISEHLLVLNTMYSIIETLNYVDNIVEEKKNKHLIEDAEYMLGLKLPKNRQLFEALIQALQKETANTQKAINEKIPSAFYNQARSFSSSVLPLLGCLKKISKLSKSHFALMYDDAHDLNEYQIKALNSWISYRENYQFSFKVATAKVDQPTQITASGGAILDGHDYVLIDMEQPYQNQDSAFGHLAKQIIKKRLENIDVKKSPEDFFPINPTFLRELEECKVIAKKEAKEIFHNAKQKQISDYIYKYSRVIYFRRRSAKANRPPYSGFEMLVHLSTGVVRNLLEPCYWMYDRIYSERRSNENEKPKIEFIDPSIQTEIILDRSTRKWDWMKNRLDKTIEGCSREQATHIFQLFDNLAILFRERLLKHKSEPRAIAFTISETSFSKMDELNKLLNICRKAQILYTHSSSAKDLGRREVYYVLNRMLLPDRGLDPVGQHARVSIRASVLWAAAIENKKIPITQENDANIGLFNDYAN